MVTEKGRLEVAERVLNDSYRRATRPEEKSRIEAKMLEVSVRHELYDLNERFQVFLVVDDKAGASFSEERGSSRFSGDRSATTGRDMMGRPLTVNNLGRIVSVDDASGSAGCGFAGSIRAGRRNSRFSALLPALALAGYLACLPSTVQWGDSGELAYAAANLTVAHPPGYPLFCSFLGHAFSQPHVRLGTVFWRLSASQRSF